ncbi:MAG TPA: hypothetical protein VF955_04330, partial [Pyrinomonadaceae bacterium]
MKDWLDDNNRYLEASLQWLRLRLKKLVPQENQSASYLPEPDEPIKPPGDASRGRFSKWVGASSRPVKEVLLLPEGKQPSLGDQIAEAAAERNKAAGMDPPPALLLLADRFGLSSFERDTLLLCAAVEFDPSLASWCELAQGQSRNYPTFSLALSLFDDASWDALSAQRPLRYARLIEISQPGSTPLTAGALRADERIVNFLKGLNVLDDRLATLVQALNADEEAAVSESQRTVVDSVFQRLRLLATGSSLPVIQLIGIDAGSRVSVARQVCELANRRLYSLSIETLPAQLPEMEMFVRLWQRESALLPVALYVDVDQVDNTPGGTSASLLKFLSRSAGMVFVGARDTPLPIRGASFSVEVAMPTAAEQCEAWTNIIEALAPEQESREIAQRLAGQFNLNQNDIHRAAESSQSLADDEPIETRLWRAGRDFVRPRLDSLAQRLEPKATWDDLVLPDEHMLQLRQIAGQVRDRHKVYDQWGFARTMNRGFGISALFSGESGT